MTESRKLVQIRTIEEFRKAGTDLRRTVVKALDLSEISLDYWTKIEILETYFLGCSFESQEIESFLEKKQGVLLHRFEGLPYDPYRKSLYTPFELQAKQPKGGTLDETIYADYIAKGRFSPDVIEALTRRIHDDSIDDGLEQLISEKVETNIVAFMGGSAALRTDSWYRKTAEAARLLARDGRFIVSGGGPGMMEAANFGAYFSVFPLSAFDEALQILSKAPSYSSAGWAETAEEVRLRFPGGTKSLGVPTWFYGFEPTNHFAGHVAKYFDNSIREGGLVQIGKAGVVFAPGSAGTRQEIFMDAAQNHYGTTGFFSAMVFLGKYQYQVDVPVYALLQGSATSDYKDFLFATDIPEEVASFVRAHPPKKKP